MISRKWAWNASLNQPVPRMAMGMVQWTTGNRVQMMADNGMSVSIDVSRLDQSSYTSLRGGERIRVVGYTSSDRTRVIAESLEVGDASSGFWTFPQAS